MAAIEKIKAAFYRSWETDKIACIFELIGTIFTMIASMTLAITAKDPNMAMLFPIYQIGSICLAIAYYRRDMFWSNGLMWYFIVLNSIGFMVAIDLI